MSQYKMQYASYFPVTIYDIHRCDNGIKRKLLAACFRPFDTIGIRLCVTVELCNVTSCYITISTNKDNNAKYEGAFYWNQRQLPV